MTFFSQLLRRRETWSEICSVKEEILFIVAVPFVELGFPSVYTSVFIVSVTSEVLYFIQNMKGMGKTVVCRGIFFSLIFLTG